MYLPNSSTQDAPLQKSVRASQERPGMYLIALRTHLGRGKGVVDPVTSTAASTAASIPIEDEDEA